MATGDLVKLGALYVGGIIQPRPTRPWRNDSVAPGASAMGNIPVYRAGQTIEIRDTSTNESNQICWREVVEGNKKYFICDRNILVNISWDNLNDQNLIKGKSVNIDGQEYLLRVLTGGEDYRIGGNRLSGGRLPNEWDQWVTNEVNLIGLPKPTATDLDGSPNAIDLNGAHNQFWNWFDIQSWTQEIYLGNSRGRAVRGYHSPREWNWDFSSNFALKVGYRPVLEVLETSPTPNSKIVIGGQQRKITDMHVVIGGQQRKVVEGYTIIGGVPKKWV